MDLTLTVKDHLGDYEAGVYAEIRQVVWFEFANGKTASFSITYSDGKYRVQSMNDSTFEWTTHHTLSESEIASYQGENGIDFRVVRTGTTVDIYLDGTKVCNGIDLTTTSSGNATNVTADMAATVTIRHYGNKGHQVDIPFTVANAEVVETPNTDLFYCNDLKTLVADPFVLDNTKVDGYYYLYGTKGACYCYRSTDLMNWEAMGDTIEVSDVVGKDIWAPEVVYDKDTETYYMFFSATPIADPTYTENNASQVLYVATSKYPYKDFTLVDFKDESSCGETNLHTYSEETYPHYYAKYLMLDPALYDNFSDKEGGYLGAIDPHPYVDEDGTKYLFWVDSRYADRICGVKMTNWLQPDWSTATVLTYYGYYTVADWKAAQAGETVDAVEYELTDNTINEGPVITKHNGKYYLTYSANNYKNSNYLVAQAVSDSILGDYRKLTMKEGGVLLCSEMTENQEITGTGHHSFATVGEQTYIVYHRHNDSVAMGSARNHAIDEVKWITIKDKDGNDLDVMYVNGPTYTPQPKIEAFSEYKNIAGEATISGVENSLSYLTDGLFSFYSYNLLYWETVMETVIPQTTTFTFEFETARPVSAVMVYNSSMEEYCFRNISKIELVCVEDGEEVVRTFENIEFSASSFGSYVIPGAAAYVDFMELNVKSIRITVEVPEGQDLVGISEIKILGQ